MSRACFLLALAGVLALGSNSFAQKAAPPARPAAPKAPAAKAPATKAPAPAAPTPNARDADERAIRAAAEAFAKHYSAHDPKAIAGQFLPDGELIDESGDVQHGREAIEQVFSDVFDTFPDSTMTVDIKSIRFVGPSLAVESGVANVTREPGGTAAPSAYSVLHTKGADGKWLMAIARDVQDNTAPAQQYLEQLAWLVGDWVDESPASLIKTSYRWSEDKHFLLSEYTLQISGQPAMSGSQRIGWDPLAKVIRSWVFDSAGGFSDGVYAREGESWIIKLSGVTTDGQPSTATNTLTRAGKDRMTWQSRDRTAGEQVLEDIDEVIVVRQPPAAAAE